MPGGPRDKPHAAQEGPPTAHGSAAFLGLLSPPRRRIPWGLPDLCPYHTAPRLWCPEFPQIKTKLFINFCFLFASFPPGWGAEIKAQRRSQVRRERDMLGTPTPPCLRSRCLGHQEATCWRPGAVCAAAKCGSEATPGLPAPSYIPISWLWAVPSPHWAADGREPGRGAGRSLNKLQPQPEAESEMMGAGVGVVTAEVPGRPGDGVSAGQAWEWVGRGGVLGHNTGQRVVLKCS